MRKKKEAGREAGRWRSFSDSGPKKKGRNKTQLWYRHFLSREEQCVRWDSKKLPRGAVGYDGMGVRCTVWDHSDEGRPRGLSEEVRNTIIQGLTAAEMMKKGLGRK